MFGLDDHDDNNTGDAAAAQPAADNNVVPDSGMPTSDAPHQDAPQDDTPPPPAPDDNAAPGEPSGAPAAPAPSDDHTDDGAMINPDNTDSNVDEPTVDTSPASSDDAASDTTASPAATDDELLNLKKQTIEELSPLLSQLDQTPEEKFRTTMMMIQATDSSNLIPMAHEAALQISDEKERAQALLDIVNEINYFTHAGEADDTDDAQD